MSKGNGPSYNGHKPGKSSGSPLAEAINRLVAEAASIKHNGHMTTFHEAQDLPHIFRSLANIFQWRLDEYKKSSISPEYTMQIANLVAALDQLATSSAQFATLFEATHKELLANLTDAPEPEKWDTHNNI